MRFSELILAAFSTVVFSTLIFAQPMTDLERECQPFSKAVYAARNGFVEVRSNERDSGGTKVFDTSLNKMGYQQGFVNVIENILFDGSRSVSPSLMLYTRSNAEDDAKVSLLASRVMIRRCSTQAVEINDKPAGIVEQYKYKVPVAGEFATVTISVIEVRKGIFTSTMSITQGAGNNAAVTAQPRKEVSKATPVNTSDADHKKKIYDLTNDDQYSEALTLADQMIAKRPKDATAIAMRARALYELERTAESRAAMDKALVIDPKNAMAIFVRGLLKRADKDRAGAINDFTEALRLDPSLKIIYRYRALASYMLDKPINDVLADYDKALEGWPNDVGTLLDAGENCNHDNGPWQKCEGYFDRVLALQPDRKKAIFGKAEALYWAMQNDQYTGDENVKKREIAASFEKVAKMDPKFPNVHRRLGSLYYDLDDYDAAIREMTAAVEQKPEAYAYRIRAHAYKAKRDYTTAIADYDRALAIDPNDNYSRDARGRAAASLETQRANASKRASAQARKDARIQQALDDFEDLVSRLESLDSTYKSARDKLQKAADSDAKHGTSTLSFYRGTQTRAQSALDEAHRIIKEYLRKYNSILDSESRRVLESWENSLPYSIFGGGGGGYDDGDD